MVEPRRLRRRALIGLGAGVGVLAGTPAIHLGQTWLEDGRGEAPLSDGTIDDASHLEGARVERVAIEGTTGEATAGVQRAIEDARARGLPLVPVGAGHTMGGHTISPGGIALDLSGAATMALEGPLLRVGAGARWREILPFLDERGRAIRVMQSNADFSIGGSLGANCHGWQPSMGPLVSTVRELTIVLASGDVLRCSRSENAEVFAAAIGGYGLVGVVVEAVIDTTENVLVRSTRRLVGLERLAETLLDGEAAELAFARLGIAGGDERFEEVLVTHYRREDGAPPPLTPVPDDDLARLLFRGGEDSDFGKWLRWTAERELGSEGGELASRNQLMAEPVRRFGNRRRDRTDVLFEGFVPPAEAAGYARDVRRIVAEHRVDLLNVTVRHVLADDVTVLRYAPGEVLGFVMLFHLPRSAAADARLAAATCDLIDAAHARGGRYYLPYRPHATRAQFERSYPEAARLSALKARLDPDRMFQSRFFQRYFA